MHLQLTLKTLFFFLALYNLGFVQIRGLSLSYVKAFGAVDRPDGFFIGFKL
jgi:hypothetical protein